MNVFYSNAEPYSLPPYLHSIKLPGMSVHVNKEVKKITTHTLQKMKSVGEKISMITAYDYSFARIFDEAGIDVILVGDSASNVMAGHETTLPITLDQMIYHASSVIRGINRCFVVVDLPFGTYQANSKEALASAIRIMKETGTGIGKTHCGSRYSGNGPPGINAAINLQIRHLYSTGTRRSRSQ